LKKIFCRFGEWFVCDYRDYQYEHKTDKPITETKNDVICVSDDPDVKEFLSECDNVHILLEQEMAQVAIDMHISLKSDGLGIVVKRECDVQKLADALIARGWEEGFIPIGP
jgi:broad-specificity NMP kinase